VIAQKRLPQDRREESVQPHKQDAIRVRQAYPLGHVPTDDDQLLTENQILLWLLKTPKAMKSLEFWNSPP